jgi:hypothetical protein
MSNQIQLGEKTITIGSQIKNKHCGTVHTVVDVEECDDGEGEHHTVVVLNGFERWNIKDLKSNWTSI